jgi:type IV fimbrial biogenesis protein FimT
MRQLNRAHGLTLIELAVTMAISAILVGMAAPYFGEFVSNSRLREGGNMLMSEALFAQSEAIKRNGSIRLAVAGDTISIIDMAPAVPVTLRSRTLATGLTATTVNVNFGSNGMLVPFGTDAAVDLGMSGITCSSEQRCPGLRIDAGGGVRLCGNHLSCT